MEIVLPSLLSFFLGFAASFAVWLFTIRGIPPKIDISEFIVRVPSVYHNEKPIPKIKIENRSKSDVFELNLKGRLFLFGLVEAYPDMPTLFIVNVGSGAHPYLMGREDGMQEQTSGRAFRLHMNKTTQKKMAESVFHLPEGQTPTLHDYLMLNDKNYIEICVFSSHSFSFTRGMCKRKYHKDDFADGYFVDHGVSVRSSPGLGYKRQEVDAEGGEETE